MDNKEILKENIKEYLKEASQAEKDSAFNSATTLYFKALAVLIDLFILEKEGFIPSNHNERFRLLELKYPLLYKILDKDFPIYQQSYRLKLAKDHAEVLKNDFKRVIEFTGIRID